MDTTKSCFVERANKYGIISVRERNPQEDLMGWGALEFILNNGEVFLISASPFGQGIGQDGLWIDRNALAEAELHRIQKI